MHVRCLIRGKLREMAVLNRRNRLGLCPRGSEGWGGGDQSGESE